MSDLIWRSARSLTAAMRRRELSAEALMNACYDQIERVNPSLNALVSLLPREEALALARTADTRLAQGAPVGPLHGLPMAPKDLIDAAGFPTTQGFVPFAHQVAAHDCLLTARQRAAGALYIGKSNTPEFGLGSHTFNSLFGLTRNPWDPERSAGGSSGGAAVALATGMLPLADGSDMGGSLRNPASFCNVVGLRPSIGRVPDDRPMAWLARLSSNGPMARSVADAALLLSVQAGPALSDPLSLERSGLEFDAALHRDLTGVRIAWSPDLGLTPVDGEVASLVERAADTFAALSCRVAADAPDLSGAMDVFQIQRAAALAVTGRTLEASIPDWRRHAKDTAVWNIERGFALEAGDLLESEVQRSAIYRRVVRFFDHYDALVLPAAQVPPFPAELEWVSEINGRRLDTYLDWMTICCAISVTGLPAISVPGGFTRSGLPVGIQIVAGPRQDFELLQLAYRFEQATGFGQTHPEVATG
ncbi:MAG: amidase [Pseudomonadales bacterium]